MNHTINLKFPNIGVIGLIHCDNSPSEATIAMYRAFFSSFSNTTKFKTYTVKLLNIVTQSFHKLLKVDIVGSISFEIRDSIFCIIFDSKIAEDPEKFSLLDLRFVLSDLFAAATDTTSNTLKFGLLYMVVNPDIQELMATSLVIYY